MIFVVYLSSGCCLFCIPAFMIVFTLMNGSCDINVPFGLEFDALLTRAINSKHHYSSSGPTTLHSVQF